VRYCCPVVLLKDCDLLTLLPSYAGATACCSPCHPLSLTRMSEGDPLPISHLPNQRTGECVIPVLRQGRVQKGEGMYSGT